MDLLNLGNLINSKWGVYQNSEISNNSRILKYEGVNASNEPTFSMATTSEKSYDYYVDNSQCWQLQFGLRYKFN